MSKSGFQEPRPPEGAGASSGTHAAPTIWQVDDNFEKQLGRASAYLASLLLKGNFGDQEMQDLIQEHIYKCADNKAFRLLALVTTVNDRLQVEGLDLSVERVRGAALAAGSTMWNLILKHQASDEELDHMNVIVGRGWAGF